MDPNDCLEEMLHRAKKMMGKEWPDPDDSSRLAELVEALDGWLSKGGFLPKKWERKPPVIEVKTSPLAGYMAKDGQTYCLLHGKVLCAQTLEAFEFVGMEMARNADMACDTCGERLAK